MAVVWANSSGTWDTVSIWYTYDTDTQSVVPYGKVPQSGDTVYLNGYSFDTSSINVGDGTIRNDENPYTHISGGYVGYTRQGGVMNIVGNLINDAHTLVNIQANTQTTLNITGDVHSGNVPIISKNGSNTPRLIVTINGNTETNGNYMFNVPSTTMNSVTIIGTSHHFRYAILQALVGSITIVGDIILDGQITTANATTISVTGSIIANAIVTGGNYDSFTIAGDVTCYDVINTGSITDIVITGKLNAQNNNVFGNKVITARINGDIVLAGKQLCNVDNLIINAAKVEYRDVEGCCCLSCSNIQIINANVVFRELANSETITHIISNYDIDNIQQYPQESYVLNGIQYAFGEKVGTLSPDFPQEAEVLKDVTYDNGNMVGTLEVGGGGWQPSADLIARLEQCATIPTMQSLLDAHLNDE